MIRNIVLDLDGPVLDTRQRHYACYQGILGDFGLPTLPLEEFWRLKRASVGTAQLLSASGAGGAEEVFARLWRDRIEDDDHLELDSLQEGIKQTLRDWRRASRRVVIATLRQHASRARHQVRRLGIAEYCDGVLVSSYGDGSAGKAAAVHDVLPHVDQETLWIGDTEVDVNAARTLGCRAIAVACGIRDTTRLRAAKPDAIIGGVADLVLGSRN